ncbi:MAG: SPFH domain-containing protein [Candidatus Eremiobacterota bacterium]
MLGEFKKAVSNTVTGVQNTIKSGVAFVKDGIHETVIEKIESYDQTNTEIVQRFPRQGSLGGKVFGLHLVVRDNQSAIFFANGKTMDVFGPGMHELTTMNIPVFSQIIEKATGISPFSYEVYFVNHKLYNELKWGTKEPVNFRDSDLGFVRLRAFGTFSMRVGKGNNVNIFINELVGAQSVYTTSTVEAYLKNVIVARLNDVLGELLKGKSVLDLPQYYDEISTMLKARVKEDFGKYGMELPDFFIGAITPPPNVQEMMDKRAGMAALGIKDMTQYTQYQAAESMANISKQPGGGGGGSIMGQSMQMGLGMAAGMMGAQAMHPQQQQYAPPPQAAPPPQQQVVVTSAPAAAAGVPCPQCKTQLPPGAKFCAGCGTKIPEAGVCASCQAQLLPGAKFCPNCGNKVSAEAVCGNCQTKIPAGAKFCAGCGNKVG